MNEMEERIDAKRCHAVQNGNILDDCNSGGTSKASEGYATGKICLFCSCSMSGDAPDGSQVLVCFDCAGHEGKEMIVEEDETCENFN